MKTLDSEKSIENSQGERTEIFLTAVWQYMGAIFKNMNFKVQYMSNSKKIYFT